AAGWHGPRLQPCRGATADGFDPRRHLGEVPPRITQDNEADMKSKASATWQGGLKDGSGTVSAANGAFTAIGLTFAKRVEGAEGPGTTPEELIAAAHAGCFSMAFASALQKEGFLAASVATEAVVP